MIVIQVNNKYELQMKVWFRAHHIFRKNQVPWYSNHQPPCSTVACHCYYFRVSLAPPLPMLNIYTRKRAGQWRHENNKENNGKRLCLALPHCLYPSRGSILWDSFQSWLTLDSRFAPSQWETALLCNDVSHWLGASLESVLALWGHLFLMSSFWMLLLELAVHKIYTLM